jgi:DNA invertase Pin-like site-specific DNA recombinase
LILSEVLHIYTRVSTAVQADEGMSLEFQRELGFKRAKDLGFEHKLWNEGGKSSNHEELDKRPVLSQLFNEIKRGAIKHLFVYDQSRLSRNDTVSSIFRIECAKQGVTLYNKEGKYNLSDHNDHFMKQILDAVGQFDNAQRAERTRLGKLARVRQGYWQGGPPPYGFEIKDRKLEINDEEAKWVRLIFERYASQVPTLDIKIELDRNGVEPRRKRGTWTMGSLNALMRNTHYIGYYDFKDGKSEEEIRVECPRILSSDLWNRVKATREKHMERRSSENPTKHFYLLKHVLRCAHCGTWLSGIYSAKQSKNHYYCPKKEREWTKRPIEAEDKWKRGRVCEMTRSLNIEATDQLVWNAVLDALENSSLMKETIRKELTGAGGQKLQVNAKEAKAREGKIKQLQKLIAKLDDSLVELETDRLMGKVTSAQYPKIKAKITEEKVNAEASVEQMQQLIHGAQQQKSWIDWIGKFKKKIDNYRTFSPDQKKELLQGLLTTVDVHLIDKQTHWLELNFKIPLVGDQVVHMDPAQKSKGYTVKEGESALMLEMASRPYNKKKPIQPMA